MNKQLIFSIYDVFNRIYIPKTKKPEKVSLRTKNIIFDDKILTRYTKKEVQEIHRHISHRLLDNKKLNAALFKSWKTLENMSDTEFYIHQITHYITTYRFKELGIFNSKLVHIPKDKFDLPEEIVVYYVKSVTKNELKELVKEYIAKDVGLKSEAIQTLFDVITEFEWKDLVEDCINRELKFKLCNYYNIPSDDAEETLMMGIQKVTNTTLFIKNEETLNTIQNAYNINLVEELLEEYVDKYGISKMGEIFNRHKKIFLTIKSNKKFKNKTLINKISKASKKFHKPFVTPFLTDFYNKLNKGEIEWDNKIKEKVKSYDSFKIAKLLNALEYYQNLYKFEIPYRGIKVRNGKFFMVEFDVDNLDISKLNAIIEDLKKILISRLEEKYEKVKLNTFVKIGLPISGKLFSGDYPDGTRIEVSIAEKYLITGVHWFNKNKVSVDLDLSMHTRTMKIGWDGERKSNSVMFSGDITDAPSSKGGAVEYFKFDDNFDKQMIMRLTDFTDTKPPTKYNLIIGQTDKEKMKNQIAPEETIVKIPMRLEDKSETIGFTYIDNKEMKFILSKTATSNTSSYHMNKNKLWEQYYGLHYKAKYEVTTLNDLIMNSNIEVIDSEEVDLDLTPSNFTQLDLLNVFGDS